MSQSVRLVCLLSPLDARLSFVSIVSALLPFDPTSRRLSSSWSQNLEEHLVILESSQELDFLCHFRYCNIPVVLTSIRSGKILPFQLLMSSWPTMLFKKLLTALWGFLFHATVPCTLLCVLLHRLWNLRSVVVGSFSHPGYILWFIDLAIEFRFNRCSWVFAFVLQLLCGLLCRDPGRFESMQPSTSFQNNFVLLQFLQRENGWKSI